MVPQPSCGFQARNEREVEAGSTHLSKTAKGGAASVITVPTETKGGPAPRRNGPPTVSAMSARSKNLSHPARLPALTTVLELETGTRRERTGHLPCKASTPVRESARGLEPPDLLASGPSFALDLGFAQDNYRHAQAGPYRCPLPIGDKSQGCRIHFCCWDPPIRTYPRLRIDPSTKR